jgi:hypothetical protein
MANVASPPRESGKHHKLATLEVEIEAKYLSNTGVQRGMTYVQRPRCAQLLQILARKAPPDGSPLHTTWPQLAGALGFPIMGMSVSEIGRRYETRISNSMRYLVAAGYVEPWAVSYEGHTREPNGILVRLPAGVAQSVRAAES